MEEGTTNILCEGGGQVRSGKSSSDYQGVLEGEEQMEQGVGWVQQSSRYPDLMDRTLARDCGTDG